MSQSRALEFDPTPTFHRSLRALVARADASNTPSGVLATLAAAPFGKGILRDGVTFTDTVDQPQWEEIYRALAAGALPHAALPALPALPALDDLRARAAKAAAAGVVPIGLVHVRYHQPTRRLLASILRAQRDDAEIVEPSGPLLEERTAFTASAVLPPAYWGFERMPEVHRGLSVRFRLDPDLHLSNCGGVPEAVEIDFDDGAGFRAVAYGDELVIDYDEAGERRVVLRARHGAGEPRIASFQLRVMPVTAPPPSETFEVTAEIAHEGIKRRVTVAVYLGKGNTRLTRPLMLAEGFPGGNSASSLYDRINGWNGSSFNPDAQLADALLARGYDLALLLYADGGAAIQGNAFAYLAAIQEVWRRMGGSGQIAVAGGSMGGLVARYALAYAETHGIATGNVTSLLTFDSPHVGANVPLSIQAVSRFFAEAGAGDVCRLLDLRAARQMLVAQRWTYDQNETWQKDDYTSFYRELAGLGSRGYPSRIKKYAVANGAASGATGIQPLTPAVIWRLGGWDLPLAKAEAWCTPNGTEGTFSWCVAATVRWPGRSYYVAGNEFFTRDGCAGGTADTFGAMATTFRKQKGAVWSPVQLNCFVPAHSALGCAVSNAYTWKASDLRPGDLPFDAWYAGAGNQPHATVDKPIKEWILQWFA